MHRAIKSNGKYKKVEKMKEKKEENEKQYLMMSQINGKKRAPATKDEHPLEISFETRLQ